jgi:hypothetical protein
MSMNVLVGQVKAWITKTESPTPICLFRITLGSLAAIKLAMLYPERSVWFSEEGVLPLTVWRATYRGRFSLLAFWPQDDNSLRIFFALTFFSALCLAIGMFSRTNAILTFLGLVSLDHRNPLIVNGGDLVLRSTAFFLIFSPLGSAYSIDRVIRLLRGRKCALQEESALPRRIIQMQIALVYLSSAVHKLSGSSWRSGEALYYIFQVNAFKRLPATWLLPHPMIIHFLTWATLAIELALGTLIWSQLLRRYVLASGLMLHLGMEIFLCIPMFQWTMMAALLVFLSPGEITQFAAGVRKGVGKLLGAPIIVPYDCTEHIADEIVKVPQSIDILRLR